MYIPLSNSGIKFPFYQKVQIIWDSIRKWQGMFLWPHFFSGSNLAYVTVLQPFSVFSSVTFWEGRGLRDGSWRHSGTGAKRCSVGYHKRLWMSPGAIYQSSCRIVEGSSFQCKVWRKLSEADCKFSKPKGCVVSQKSAVWFTLHLSTVKINPRESTKEDWVYISLLYIETSLINVMQWECLIVSWQEILL